ncbi:MAG: ComEC/Rec2 family competence protein [Planctomycetota bacterium]
MKRKGFDQSDHIRLKLQWLDEHFGPQASLMQKTFSTTPLLPIAFAFIAGIILTRQLETTQHVFPFVAFLTTISIILLLIAFWCSGSKRLLAILTSAVLLFASVGMIRLASVQCRGPRHISRLLNQDRCLATVRGQVVSPVLVNQSGDMFSTIPWLNSQSSFYLQTNKVHTADGWQDTTGRVRVQVSDIVTHIRPGQAVQIYCWLDSFSSPANPGQFDLSNHMSLRGVYTSASVSGKEGIEIIDDSTNILANLRRCFYRFASDSLLDDTMTDTDAAALSSALLLGRRFDLKPELIAAFQQTNLSHFISLSGMHVAILAGSLWMLLKRMQLPKRPRAMLCIILILLFAMVVPPRAPTMRAIFLSCFFFASELFYRRINPLNTLALSAIVLLYARPYDLFSAGWQLSFLSVFGIIVFYKSVHYALTDKLFFPLVILFQGRLIVLQHLFYRAVELLAIGFSAWIVISPLLLYYFGQVNPLSPLWTTLTVLFIALILYAGFWKIALASLLPTAAALLGLVLNILAQILEAIVTLLAKIDWLSLTAHRPGLTLILTLYGLLILFWLVPYRRRRIKQFSLAVLAICFCLPFINSRLRPLTNDTLEMTCLSVGHGQAVVLSTPCGLNFLFDGGSITHQHLARKTISPFLQSASIFGLDGVWISHGDLDHINGIPHLAATVPIAHLYANAALIENSQRPSLEKQFTDSLAELSLTLEPVTDYTTDTFRIRSLWPDKNTTVKAGISENDVSQVLLIAYAGKTILLCGDIEAYAQERLLEKYPTLKPDVMVLPHHGSTNNLNPEFVEKLSPSAVITSCSTRHAPRAWQPPEDSGIQAFYTATDGAVTVKIKADGTLSADGFLKTAH